MKDYGVMAKVDQGDAPDEMEQPRALPVQAAPRGAFEIDVQKTAALRPRDIKASMQEATILVSDADIAATMWYRLERRDRKTGKVTVIQGPSIRMAELMAYSWRNVAYAGNILEVTDDRVIAEGMAVDLERNNPVRVTVSRSIVDKGGRRYSDDLIQLICGVAQSIAMRNAIFKVIPGAFVKRILEHAQAVAEGGGKETIGQRRAKAFAWLRSQDVTEEEVLRLLQVDAVTDIGEPELSRLRGLCQAIQDGEHTVDEVFRRPFEERAHEEAEALTSSAKPISPGQAEPAPAKDDRSGKAAAPPQPKPPAAKVSAAAEAPAAEGPATRLPPVERVPSVLAAVPPRAPLDLATIHMQGEVRHGKATWRLLWPHVQEAARRPDGDVDPVVVGAIVAVPKTILAAALKDEDIVGTLRQVAEAAGAQAQPKLV